jgi:hypothetical protein
MWLGIRLTVFGGIVAVWLASSAASAAQKVTVESGTLEGKSDGSVRAFLGTPLAGPVSLSQLCLD